MLTTANPLNRISGVTNSLTPGKKATIAMIVLTINVFDFQNTLSIFKISLLASSVPFMNLKM